MYTNRSKADKAYQLRSAISIPDVVPAILDVHCKACPRSIATKHQTDAGIWVSSTWEELWHEVRYLAQALRELGLKVGDRFAIFAKTRPEWQLADMAVLLAGGIVVGIDHRASSNDISYIIKHSGSSFLLTESEEDLARIPAELLEAHVIILLSKHNVTEPVQPVHVFKEVLFRGRDSGYIKGMPSPGDPATIIYTSGTTGKPKGILYSHRQLLDGCRSYIEAGPFLGEKGTCVAWMPMAYLFQRMFNLVSLIAGNTTYFMPEPSKVVDCLALAQPRYFCAVPRFYEKVHQAILDKADKRPQWVQSMLLRAVNKGRSFSEQYGDHTPLPLYARIERSILDILVLRRLRAPLGRRMRYLITGSAPIQRSTVEFFQSVGLLVLEAYGVSENTIPISGNRPGAVRLGSVGQPLPGNEVRIAPDGEILIKGQGLFNGYYNETSTDRFTRDGFYMTGDIGHFDNEGFLFLTGRKSELIKTSTGRGISPNRIEAAYRRSKYVDQIIVVGNGHPYLVALVVINLKEISSVLKLQGIEKSAVADMPLVKNLIKQEFIDYSSDLAPYEQIRRFAILVDPFTVEKDELTPTLKLRRGVIEGRYGYLIAQLYAETSPDVSDPSLRH